MRYPLNIHLIMICNQAKNFGYKNRTDYKCVIILSNQNTIFGYTPNNVGVSALTIKCNQNSCNQSSKLCYGRLHTHAYIRPSCN